MSKIKKLGLGIILSIIFILSINTKVFADEIPSHPGSGFMSLADIASSYDSVLNASADQILSEYGGGKKFSVSGFENYMANGTGVCIDTQSQIMGDSDVNYWTNKDGWKLVGMGDVSNEGRNIVLFKC